jgi:hypothetical protein
MNKTELLHKCKELGMKGVTSKNKNELLLLIKEHELKATEKTQFTSGQPAPLASCVIKNSTLDTVLQQLLSQIPKDKSRKVCKKCNEIGHSITSVNCKVNVEINNKLKQKIEKYILSQNCLDDKTINEHFNDLSIMLEISPNLCKTLYNEIPPHQLLNRQINLEMYFKNIRQLSKLCADCNKSIICIQTNTHYIWKGNSICDTCWANYSNVRKLTWEKIKLYKKVQCEICCSVQKVIEERYHYDHVNMFNKDKSICSMVNEGVDIDDIYLEIDKCQILCLSCHHIVTDIENKLGFTRIKQLLTRSLNVGEITQEQYNTQILFYQNIYEDKMKNIYKEIQLNIFQSKI